MEYSNEQSGFVYPDIVYYSFPVSYTEVIKSDSFARM